MLEEEVNKVFAFSSTGKNYKRKKKIEILRDSTDGFYIAEKDLEIRGPGQLLGKQQSGLPTYKIGGFGKR